MRAHTQITAEDLVIACSLGSMKPGMRVDLIVLYRNIYSVESMDIAGNGLTIFPLFVMHQLRPEAVRLFDDRTGLFGENVNALIGRQIELSIDDFKFLGIYTGNLAG